MIELVEAGGASTKSSRGKIMFKRIALAVALLSLSGCELWNVSWRNCSQIKTANAISHGGLNCPCGDAATK
jgi:hypothetical protein